MILPLHRVSEKTIHFISYVMGFSGFVLSAYTVVSIIRDRHLMRNNHQIK